MKLLGNLSDANLKEQVEKVLNTEELVYPLRLVDFMLKNFDFKRLSPKLHYWSVIQIHELLDDSKVFPEQLDDNTWYQYISAYLILPKMEDFININRFAWNSAVERYNNWTIKEAVRASLELLKSPILNNKVVESTSTGLTDSLILNRINTVLSTKELSYPLSFLEINLRKLELGIHYSHILSMHTFLKSSGILPAEYNYNTWYRCVAAYIIAVYVNIGKLIEINKNGWTESVRKENEELLLDADIFI